jgi:hypothetical protein
MVQLDLGGGKAPCVKSSMCAELLLFCVIVTYSEQIEKLVRLLLYTSENCSGKFHVWVHFVLSQ